MCRIQEKTKNIRDTQARKMAMWKNPKIIFKCHFCLGVFHDGAVQH